MVLSSSTRARHRQHALPNPVIGAIGALTFALAACGDVTAPLPRDGAPEALNFSIGSYWQAPTSWTVRGDTVIFQRGWWGGEVAVAPRNVVPTAEAWREFWREAENAGVNKWRASYSNDGIADAEGWQLKLETRHGRIESDGYAAYPDNAGREHEGDRTEAFRAFLSALYTLVGETL